MVLNAAETCRWLLEKCHSELWKVHEWSSLHCPFIVLTGTDPVQSQNVRFPQISVTHKVVREDSDSETFCPLSSMHSEKSSLR
mmetsp:Transcript_13896/g.15091  ORF Transcript_13896/g.15091 Transcript_13896/m.15091 type:complete len:83 (-) Transcript_13896:266-514(-)